jgi:hypothetical protein
MTWPLCVCDGGVAVGGWAHCRCYGKIRRTGVCWETSVLEKFAFGDRTIPIHARTLGPDEHNPNVMGMYYGTVQSAVVYTN